MKLLSIFCYVNLHKHSQCSVGYHGGWGGRMGEIREGDKEAQTF